MEWNIMANSGFDNPQCHADKPLFLRVIFLG